MLFFKKKIDRVMSFQKENIQEEVRQLGYNNLGNYDELIKWSFKDIMAIIISALLVFVPVVLVLIGILVIVYKSF
jgi:glutamate-1-semialdehyde aminotransferase